MQDTTRALVVAMEVVNDATAGLFTSVGAWTVKVASAVTRGNYLAKSNTAKALYDTGVAADTNPPPIGAVAIALTGSAGAGTVVGFLLTSGSGGSGGVLNSGGNVASAAALNIGSSGSFFHVTGTTGISSISTRAVGHLVVLVFDDVLTLTNGGSLVLQGGVSHTTEAGEILTFVSEGGGTWRQIALDRQTLTALTSGTITIGTTLTIGTNPASAGTIRLANTADIKARNAANDADIAALAVNNQNQVVVGNGASGDIVIAGQLRCDILTPSRLVVPVGTDKWATT